MWGVVFVCVWGFLVCVVGLGIFLRGGRVNGGILNFFKTILCFWLGAGI